MSFQDAVRICLTKKYATWEGRAGRAEYWYFFLFYVIVAVVVGIIDAAIGNVILGILVTLAFLVPSICVGIRRLHDTNRTGWWMFLSLIPVVGVIILIIFFATPSDPGVNNYGVASDEPAVA